MTTATLPLPPTTAMTPYRFSVEEFDRMIESGLFTGKGRFELIEGQVIRKMTHNPAHDNAISAMMVALLGRLPSGWILRIQSSITLPANVPEPDACVARGGRQTFATRRPEPTDIGLVVEVSDSSLADDRGAKLQTYARAGIVEYWIVNIPNRQIEVYTQPSGPTATPAYGRQQIYPAGSAVPFALDGVALGTVAVDDVIF